MSITLEDQIAAVQEEIAFRRTTYPQWQERGSITQSGADIRIATMEAVLATLKSVREDRKRVGLFDEQIQEAIDR